MISATGRMPVIAAPIAAPTIACSEMGVSQTRRGPNSLNSPTVVLNTPSAAPMSSPRHTTVGSRRISRAIPSATASRYVMVPPVAGHRQRIAGQPLAYLLGRPVGARVGAAVAEVPVGARLHDGRAAAGTGAVHRPRGRVAYHHDVVAVDELGGQPVRRRPVRGR